MIDLQSFINKYNGKSLDFDGAYPGQCVDLSKQWEHDNGWHIISGNAIDQPKNIDSTYEYIANTPSGVPKAGDLMIWGSGVGQYGHIAIFIQGNTSTFTSFDQNWPVGSKCHVQSHNYNNVIGWIRHKGDDMDRRTLENMVFGFYRTYYGRDASNIEITNHVNNILGTQPPENMIENWVDGQANEAEFKSKWHPDNQYQQAIAQAKLDAVTPLNAEIKDLTAQNGTLNGQNKDLQEKLTICTTQLSEKLTTVTTQVEHDYSVGELVALLIRKLFKKG